MNQPYATPSFGPNHYSLNPQVTQKIGRESWSQMIQMARYSYPSVSLPVGLLERVDTDARRLDGCRTIGYSQILVLKEIMHNIQMKSGLEETPKVSDRVSLIGASGMGGYVYL
jgi:hypothetical protein